MVMTLACRLLVAAVTGLTVRRVAAQDTLPSPSAMVPLQDSQSELLVPRVSQAVETLAAGPLPAGSIGSEERSPPTAAMPQGMSLPSLLWRLSPASRMAVGQAGLALALGTDGGAAQIAAAASYASSKRCEGKAFGAYPDSGDPGCWDFCLGLHGFGARLCCQPGFCFWPPTASCPLGLCRSCTTCGGPPNHPLLSTLQPPAHASRARARVCAGGRGGWGGGRGRGVAIAVLSTCMHLLVCERQCSRKVGFACCRRPTFHEVRYMSQRAKNSPLKEVKKKEKRNKERNGKICEFTTSIGNAARGPPCV